MRTSFITLGFCFIAAQGMAQVGYRAAAQAPEVVATSKLYDSSYDFENVPLTVDAASMIGQQLYFPPGFTEGAGYDLDYNLYIDKQEAPVREEKTKGLKFRLQAPAPAPKRYDDYSHIYKPDPARPNRTLRDSLENKFFTITSLKVEKVDDRYSIYYVYNYELKDAAGQKIYYKAKRKDDKYVLEGFEQDDRKYGLIPFYIVGYIQKTKGKLVGKAFYKKDHTGIQLYNYLTKKVETVGNRKKYVCTDFTFIDASARHAVPGLILKDEEGKEFATVWYGDNTWYNKDKAVYVSDANPGSIVGYFWQEKPYQDVLEKEKQEAEKKAAEAMAQRKADSIRNKQDAAFRSTVIKKYGAPMGNKILDGKVDLGMTMDMCKIAWGEPSSVSKNAVAGIVIETWHYTWGTHVTFKNGKVTGFAE